MRKLVIIVLGAVLFLTAPIPTLAVAKHPTRHAVKHHHWFWQHWHVHHRKPKRR
jgi:hypothetical protein